MTLDRIRMVGSSPDAVIRDTGVSVEQVIDMIHEGRSFREIREVYTLLEEADIRQAILFAAKQAAELCEHVDIQQAP